jgi:hypothetical protein
MEMSGQFHAPAEERHPSTHYIGGWVDPRVGLNSVEKRKRSLAPARNGTPAVHSVGILTELSRLHNSKNNNNKKYGYDMSMFQKCSFLYFIITGFLSIFCSFF